MKLKLGFSVAAFAFATPLLFAGKFHLGADLGWITQFEKEGKVVCDANGKAVDPFKLMKDYGVDSVRLRVWVNPKDGWNGKADTLVKARRAKALGMDVMIDFHYSDCWADPGKQPTPEAWRGHSIEEIEKLLAAHTKEVLSALKAEGIYPKWVQVGNETTNGFLWTPKCDKDGKVKYIEVSKGVWAPEVIEDVAHLNTNPKNYARLFKAGYEATKEVLPNTTVIVHLTPAGDRKYIDRNLKVLSENGAKWDMIGLSLYPYHERPGGVKKDPVKIPDFDSGVIARGIANCIALAKEWKCPTMIVETGFETEPVAPMTIEYSRTMMERTVREAREHTEGLCEGVFYWEPICPEKMYPLGAFKLKGKELHPTAIMDAFLTGRDREVPKQGMPTDGLCAHAGDTSTFPGNTVEGFASSIGKGAAMVEFDLKRCKSGETVLFHDRTVNYKGKKEKVSDLTLAQLKEVDLRGCRIPTLQEGLAVIPKEGVWLNVHCGDLAEDVPLAVDTVVYMKNDGRINQMFLSAPVGTIAAAREKVPELVGNSMSYPKNCWKHFWTPQEIKEHFEIALKNNCKFVQPHMAMLSKEDTAEFKAKGGRVNYYVCNTPLRLEPMLEGGVDFALTDKLNEMSGRYRAIKRSWETAPKAEGAVRLRMARNERAEIAYDGKGDFGELRNVDGVIFPKGDIAVSGGKLKVTVAKNIPAGIYRGKGLAIHVNDFELPDGTPPYVGPTADRGNIEAHAKVLEQAISKVDASKYPNWNWIPGAKSVIDKVRKQGAGRFGFTDDPKEYDFWRNGLAEVMDGNCRY